MFNNAVTPPSLFIFSQHRLSSFTLSSLFLSLLLGQFFFVFFACSAMGLEALGPFVRGTHLNVAQIMLWVGLDATPLWHTANGVCEDTALSLPRSSFSFDRSFR